MLLVGVHIPFDVNTAYRISQYKTNLEFLSSIIDDNQFEMVLIGGDFNSDLSRGKRFDSLLCDFINEHDLVSFDCLFENEVKHTYRNGNCRNHIDHILGLIKHRSRVINCQIIQSNVNMSDHNAVNIEFSVDNMQANNDLMATDIRKFHKFPWHNEMFVDEYNKSINSMITVFNPQMCDLSYNDKCELISTSLMDLSKLLLRCARQSENKICKVKRAKKDRRDLWTPELFETHNKLNKWRIEYKKVNSERHRCLWEFYKKKFKSMQKEGNELNKKVVALDLEKLLKIDRNKFWKKIKQNKKLSTKCNTQPSFKRFREFYSNLFINEIVDTDEHKKIKESVELKKSDLAGKVYEDMFKALDVEEAIKLLKTNKAFGVDYVCAEMIKSCSNSILVNNLVKIFNIIVKYGLKVNSINVS
jgi:hypothetical protein